MVTAASSVGDWAFVARLAEQLTKQPPMSTPGDLGLYRTRLLETIEKTRCARQSLEKESARLQVAARFASG